MIERQQTTTTAQLILTERPDGALLTLGAPEAPVLRVELRLVGVPSILRTPAARRSAPLSLSFRGGPPRLGQQGDALAFVGGRWLRAVTRGGLTPPKQLVQERFAALARLNTHLLRLVPRALREAVLPFPLATRFGLFRAVVEDPTGRVLQATRALPGLVAFALALEGAGHEAPAAALWKGLRDGLRASTLAEAAIAALRPDADDEARELHALLLRKVCARFPGDALLAGPPPELRARELPTDPTGQLAWAQAFRRLRRFPQTPTQLRRELLGFFARNPGTHALDARLARYLSLGGSIAKETNPARLRKRLRLRLPATAIEQTPPAAPGSTARPGFRCEDGWLEPIVDAEVAAREAARQFNCVAKLWGRAAPEERLFFRGELFGVRVTVRLTVIGETVYLAQLRGPANGEVPDELRTALAAWAMTGRWVGRADGTSPTTTRD